MSRAFLLCTAIVASCLYTNAAAAQETVSLERADGKNVPALVYAPASGQCRGVAVISHGAGGTEKGYAYLARFMASEDYVAIVTGHRESGTQALKRYARNDGVRDGLSKLITERSAHDARLMDISAARQWARKQCESDRSVLLGHSMGAATVMIEAGAKNKVGVTGSDAFDIYVALSPQGAGSIFPPDAWQRISRPVLSITGTRDKELSGDSWQTRTEPFKNMRQGCKWLAVIDRATHKHFSGRGNSRRTEQLATKTIQSYLKAVASGNCQAPPRMRGIAIEVK